MCRFSVPLSTFLTIFILLTTAPAWADAVELQASKDNTLYEPISQNGFADTSNALGANMFAGKVKDAENQAGQVAVRRAVIAFQIAGNVPPGATIDSVQLTMVVNKAAQSNSFSTDLHRLLEDWGEGTSNTGNSQQGRGDVPTAGDATWNHTFYSGSLWSTPGGFYSTTNSASTLVGGTGSYNWGSTSGMVADVQFWLDNAAQNFGWIVIGDESQIETAKRFATRENTDSSGATRPMLLINYTPSGGPTGACCDPADSCTVVASGTCLSPDTYQGDGTTCSSHPCSIPTGACCASNGTCSETEQLLCEGAGGVYQADGSTCAGTYCSIALTPFIDPLPFPPVATPTVGAPDAAATYDISMVEFPQQMHSELPGPTTVWGYKDSFAATAHTPGPIIVARSGEPVTVNWINDLRENAGAGALRTDHHLAVDVLEDGEGNVCIHGAENTAKAVVHLHGGHVPSAVDGYPESSFVPGNQAAYCVTDEFIVCTDDVDCPAPSTCDGDGDSCTTDADCVGHGGNEDCLLCQVGYTYPNEQKAGYLWFHDHALGVTRLNVMMGLAGAYLVRDSVEDALNIPKAPYEVPLVIQDREFNPDGSIRYPAAWQDMWFGDKIIVNGAVWPYLNVDQGKYRFRLLNGSTSRVYTLSLNPPSGLLTFTVIATEGGFLETPVNGVGQLTMGPGERYDVVVDFAGYNTGDEIFLENSATAPFPGGSVDVTDVMKFVVTNQVGDTDAVPGTLTTIDRIPEDEAILSRDFLLKRSGTDGCGRSIWEINGLHWDDITEFPDLGTTEIWRFVNDSNVSHPMHMHLVFFQILDREGFTGIDGNGDPIPDGNVQPPLAEENGWKDTAMVGPNEMLRVIVRFKSYKGKYAYHCHILEHEEHEMMRQFQTVDCGDLEIDVTETCDDGNPTGNDGCSSGCVIEEYVELAGIASGGGPPRVDVTVSGILIRITTTAGQTATQVAQAIVDAINANVALQALGVTATLIGNRVVTTGDITLVDIRDTGLSDVQQLSVTRTQLWWGNVEAATGGYDVVKGDLGPLHATLGDYSDPLVTQACIANDQAATYVDISADDPDEGEAYWYLLRAQPGGSFESGGSGQAGTRETEIGSSGNGCP
jgi:spore coat protein A